MFWIDSSQKKIYKQPINTWGNVRLQWPLEKSTWKPYAQLMGMQINIASMKNYRCSWKN
jgi:hypothetical protein